MITLTGNMLKWNVWAELGRGRDGTLFNHLFIFQEACTACWPPWLCKTKLGHPTLWDCITWGLPFHPNVHFSHEGQGEITYIHPRTHTHTHTRIHHLFPVTSTSNSLLLEIQRVPWAESSPFTQHLRSSDRLWTVHSLLGLCFWERVSTVRASAHVIG